MTRRRSVPTLVLLVLAVAGRATAAEVTLDGVVLPKAVSSIDVPVEVTEFREIGVCPHLIPGCPKPSVCVTTPAPVAALDAQLAGAAAARFSVGVEDGRTFGQCVLASLNADGAGGKRRYVYCLRCEGVTAP